MVTNFTIKTKLFLLVAIPSIAYLLLASNTLYNSYIKEKETVKTIKYINKYSDITNGIFALQTERKNLLNYSYNQKLNTKTDTNKIFLLTNKVLKSLSSNTLLRKKLDNLRKMFLNNELSYLEIQNQYSLLIELLLNKQAKDIFDTNDKNIIKSLYKNNKLLNIIENANKELFLSYLIISKQKTDKNITNEFKYAYMNEIKIINTIEKFNYYKEYLDTTQHIINNLENNTITNELESWYKLSAKRILFLIDKYKFEEDKLLAYTIDTANNQKNVFNTTLISIIIIFLLIVIFLMSITNNINNSLKILSEGIDNFILFIIYRDKQVFDININSNDEIGKMAFNINKNRKLIEACFKCDEMVIKEVSQVVKNAKKDIHLIYEIKCFADNVLLENMKFDFNEMMNILKQKTDELALYDSNLEKTIKEKTSELEKTNSKLQISHNILKEEQIRLNSFSTFLSNLNSVNIKSLAKHTLKQIYDISGSMMGYFIMYDEKGEFKIIATESIDKETLEKNEQFITSSPIIKESLLSNRLISINDLPSDSLEPVDIGFAKLNLNNFYSFPLVFQNKPLGVLVLASSKHIDVNYLQGYITALTGSVNNAMSYHYIQEQAIVLEKANIELQKSDKMKSEFLANMSHELRTPLNSIIGFSSILKKNKKSNLDEKQIDQLSKINNNGNHLLGLINNILDLSKIESGKIELDTKDFELIHFIKDIVGMLHAQAEEKNINLFFTNELEKDSLILHTDDVKLRQVCINLIGNALKFVSSDSGEVEIVVKKDNKFINICINDNGVGIPKDKLELIFEPFRQADGSTTRKFGGTGLGLAISKNMIELLNGTIEVSSKVNKGSSFCIRLSNTCIVENKSLEIK